MKKAISILLTFGMMLSLAACQPTPQEAIIVPKDAERMVEKASEQPGGTQVESLDVPLTGYTFDSTGADGKLRIHVDANMQMPDAATMPILRASVASFSQEQVKNVFNYLFPNEKPVSNTQVETKSDIEKEILRMKQQLAQGNHPGYTAEQYEAMIAQMEASYLNAPDSAPESKVSDGTMTLYFDNQTQTPLFWTISVANKTARFSASTPADVSKIGNQDSGAVVGGALMHYKRSDIDYSLRNVQPVDEATMPDNARGKLTISYADATKLCEEVFAAAGMSDMFCVGMAHVIDDTGADEVQGSRFAYRLCYTRKTADVPLFSNYTVGVLNQDKTFRLPWNYEYAEFVIDNDGIVSMTWSDPISIGEIIEQNATLKPFSEIKSVFEAMMKTNYEGIIKTTLEGQCELDINVDDARLCLMRIREQNASQTDGLLVPAWVFYGQNKATGNGGEIRYLQGASVLSKFDPSKVGVEYGATVDTFIMLPSVQENVPVVIMAINAVDGSMIDITAGY